MTGTSINLSSSQTHPGETAQAYFDHSSAPRVNTDTVVIEALRREYPHLHLTVIPTNTCNLIAWANSSDSVTATPIDEEKDRLTHRQYIPARRRLDGEQDGIADLVLFGKFLVKTGKKEFIVVVANGRDGDQSYPSLTYQYVLSASSEETEMLVRDAGRWTNNLHDEVWMFDGGFWQKSSELWDSVKNSKWEDVILAEDMKKAIIKDVDNFYNGRETYTKLKVPWKRGVIYYGPPGNGKTISIKAMMHSLLQRKDPVPTLYVRSLVSYGGPEYAIAMIFNQARRFAPCYLVFEDIDTLIAPSVRSYFLNEVDGLKSNDGIFMIGSTNHLDQLDPGIAKRPSRFDRKYLFPDPSEEQRTMYAKYWQGKLKDNKDIEFPDSMCKAVAGITGGFSFAYMQEAFVASLLAIAGRQDEDEDELKMEQLEIADQEAENELFQGLDNEQKQRRREILHSFADVCAHIQHGEKDQATLFTAHVVFAPGASEGLWPFLVDRLLGCRHNVSALPGPGDETLYHVHQCATLQVVEALRRMPFVREVHVQSASPAARFWEDDYKLDTPSAADLRGHEGFMDTVEAFIGPLIEQEYCGQMNKIAMPAVATDLKTTGGGEEPKLDHLILWRELKKQVKILKEEMDEEKGLRSRV